jgi:hypothetical protein
MTMVYASSFGGTLVRQEQLRKRVDELTDKVENHNSNNPDPAGRMNRIDDRMQALENRIQSHFELVASHTREMDRFMGKVDSKLDQLNGHISGKYAKGT